MLHRTQAPRRRRRRVKPIPPCRYDQHELTALYNTNKMATRSLRILHLSDVHFGQTIRSGTAWRLRRVLGEAWKKNLDEIRADGTPDLICFTGDIAFSGQASEYAEATVFFDELLARLGVDKSRLFVVPGNHDVDRDINKSVWEKVRAAVPQVNLSVVAQWMAGGKPPFGFDAAWREAMLERQRDYRAWLDAYGLTHCLPGARGQAHPHLGYRATVSGWSQPVNIVGLDSAWLAGDDNDVKKLLLTERQIGAHLCDVKTGARHLGVAIALAHHPLADLGDTDAARHELNQHNVALLLHGHLHKPTQFKVQTLNDAAHAVIELAAGCLYEDKGFPNSFQVIDVNVSASGPATIKQLWARGWRSDIYEDWFDDPRPLPPVSPNGRWRPATVAPARLPTGRCFGRDDDLALIRQHLLSATPLPDGPRCMVLSGMPGVGKSRLAHTFVRDHWAVARGVDVAQAYVRLTLEPTDADGVADAATAQAAAITLGQRIADQLRLNANATNLWSMLPTALAASGRLLLIENVDSDGQRQAAGALVARLPGCTVLVTARQQNLGYGAGWAERTVQPLKSDASLELFHDELQGMAGRPPPDDALRELAHTLGHLPLALHIAAAHLRDGTTPAAFLKALVANGFTAEPSPADAALNEERARAVLNSSFSLAWDQWQKSRLPVPVVEELRCMAHAPADGVGESLGAALCAMSDDDYNVFIVRARQHSLLELVDDDGAAMPRSRHRMHPLLAEWFRKKCMTEAPDCSSTVITRLADWMCDRMTPGENQKFRRDTVQREDAALLHLLSRCEADVAIRVEREGRDYATDCGPYAAWTEFCDRHQQSATGSDRSNFLWTLTQVAMRAGDLDRALVASREKRKFDQLHGRSREVALAWGAEAEVLAVRGELEKALRILQEEQLPVFERLGDRRERALVFVTITNLLHAQGKFEDAQQLLVHEVIPIFKSLGDERLLAISYGKIASIHAVRGEFEQALRIWREIELPVYEALGETRSRAITLGKIAVALSNCEQYDEALHTFREELLPIFQSMGDVHAYAVTMGKIADILYVRGEMDEVLRIRREEELPVFERMGDVGQRAVTLGKIAQVLYRCGELDEALRIRRYVELPIYEQMGDLHSRAIALGSIAGMLSTRGELDEAVGILSKETIPALERMGDVRSWLVARANLASTYMRRQAAGDVDEAKHLLDHAATEADRLHMAEAARIRELLDELAKLRGR